MHAQLRHYTAMDSGQSELEVFKQAVGNGDAAAARRLLEGSPQVRGRINDPLFSFGQRPAHVAAKNIDLLAVLIEHGADVNLRSEWKNGPFTVLDNSDEASARFLIEHGARLTAHAAARLGWSDGLRDIVDADPAVVHERGGDGQQPLHQAKTPEIADFLLDRGAEIDTHCIDHRTTPAQYALAERPEVCQRLLDRGATADIFMPARLGDAELAQRLIRDEPACLSARVNAPGYDPVPPLHTYCWTLGFLVSPHEIALRYGHRGVYDLLFDASPPGVRLLDALMRADEAAAGAVMAADPSVLPSLLESSDGSVGHAIFHERYGAAALMLSLGFSPTAPSLDGGSPLHVASWVGHVGLVERLLEQGVPLDEPDPTHGSTPLGWAAFGSVQRRAKGGDYCAVIDRLADAGADVGKPGNRFGRTMLEMAAGNGDAQAALRRHGAG